MQVTSIPDPFCFDLKNCIPPAFQLVKRSPTVPSPLPPVLSACLVCLCLCLLCCGVLWRIILFQPVSTTDACKNGRVHGRSRGRGNGIRTRQRDLGCNIRSSAGKAWPFFCDPALPSPSRAASACLCLFHVRMTLHYSDELCWIVIETVPLTGR